jgi:hypothetical protein
MPLRESGRRGCGPQPANVCRLLGEAAPDADDGVPATSTQFRVHFDGVSVIVAVNKHRSCVIRGRKKESPDSLRRNGP